MNFDDVLDERNCDGRNLIDDEIYPSSEIFRNSINIGRWENYGILQSDEQRELQLQNLLRISNIRVCDGQLRFIYTKTIDRYNERVEELSKKIKIQDTKTVLEDEVYYTAKIEGAKTTRVRTTELHNGMPIDKNNEYSERMVKNSFDAVKLINLYGNELTHEKLRNVWEVLTDKCRDNSDIQGDLYRSDTVYIGEHEGLNPNLVQEYMNEWLQFYNSRDFDDKPFIKAAVLHYAFENIHPYCDGNGRMGRLLMNNYLISRNVESCRAVSFSMQIDKTRPLYDAAFMNSENRYCDCTPFVEYMLSTFAESFASALKVQSGE